VDHGRLTFNVSCAGVPANPMATMFRLGRVIFAAARGFARSAECQDQYPGKWIITNFDSFTTGPQHTYH
jgi:hypothetical protein